MTELRFGYERTEQLEGFMKEVHTFACAKLNISPVRILLETNSSNTLNGVARKSIINEIVVIENNITTYEKLVDLLLHETRHIWQFNRTDIDWKHDTYVQSHINYEMYYNHITEVDARTFARVFANKFKSELQIMINKCKNNEYETKQPIVRELSELDLLFGIDTNNEPVWG